jgi:hypothetical protein
VGPVLVWTNYFHASLLLSNHLPLSPPTILLSSSAGYAFVKDKCIPLANSFSHLLAPYLVGCITPISYGFSAYRLECPILSSSSPSEYPSSNIFLVLRHKRI